MNNKTLLIFPANIDGSTEFARIAKDLGFKIIYGTSINTKSIPEDFSELVHLPFITDEKFQPLLFSETKRKTITHIYTLHHGVWWYLKKIIEEFEQRNLKAPFVLTGTSPYVSSWRNFSQHLLWAEKMNQCDFSEKIHTENIAPKLNIYEYASLHRGFLRITGESDEEKLSAICSIARILPPGEIIEIGALYGRSSYALASLAKHYQIGSTISVDPWEIKKVEDQGPKAKKLFESRSLIDLEQVFKEFCTNASEVEGWSYIRSTSVEAVEIYQEAISKKNLKSKNLAAIPIKGEVSLLHIDGNHRYDHVVKDIETWIPFIKPGGWLLLDDYVWSFGDGPKKAGDELLNKKWHDIAFVCSDTLFLRKSK